MKVTFETGHLESAISAAAKIVNTHTTVPILTTVLITADEDGVRVRATDLEVTLERKIAGAVVHEHGSVAVGARLLADYVSKLPRGSVDIMAENRTVVVQAGRARVALNKHETADFPPPPMQNGSFAVSIPSNSFKSGIRLVEFAASTEESRGAVLMGTLLSITEDRTTMVATDGYRLSHQSVAIVDKAEETCSVIIPTRALQEVTRNVGNSENVRVTLVGKNNNQTRFETEHAAVTVRNVDGSYPNWKNIVPTVFENEFTANNSDLRAALGRIAIIARADNSKLVLNISGNTLTITAGNESSGSAKEMIEIRGWEGEDFKVFFNGTYLKDAADHIDSDEILFRLNGATSPARVQPTGDVEATDHFIVLMPLAG